MKTITEKVVVEKEFYIAIDGKKFENEDDCLAYEMEARIATIEAYDDDFNRIDFESAKYVVVHSEEEIDEIEEICNYNGWTYEGIDKPGIYIYDSSWREDKWVKIRIPHTLADFIEFI